MPLKTHNVTADTPNRLLLGAGTFYKNLTWNGTEFTGEILGATSGGGTITITPEYFNPDIDGATVKIRGMIWKVGEEATIEANITEFSEGLFVNALHMVEITGVGNPASSTHKLFQSVAHIGEPNFLDNVAYVGTLTGGTSSGVAGGRQFIIVLENALCTAEMSLSPQDGSNATFTAKFECTATFAQDDLNHLPYKIYYPNPLP